MRISDWSSDVCSSDLAVDDAFRRRVVPARLLPVPDIRAAAVADADTGTSGDVLSRTCLRHPRRHHCLQSDLRVARSEEHTSELQSLMRISYAVFCLTKKITIHTQYNV